MSIIHIKLSRPQVSKIIQLGGPLGNIIGNYNR